MSGIYIKLNHYIGQMSEEAGWEMPADLTSAFAAERLDSLTMEKTSIYLGKLSVEFKKRMKEAIAAKDSLIRKMFLDRDDKDRLIDLQNTYYNNWLADFILNADGVKKYIDKPDVIIRKYKPGFMMPTSNNGRAHFCAPFKIIGNTEIDTFWFNLTVIWLVSVVLYFALYFNILRKIVTGFGEGNKRRSDSRFMIIKEISSW